VGSVLGVRLAARKATSAREGLRQAILLAKSSGETYNDIGNAAGVTAQHVQQIVKEANGG
jgi:DNA-directed RNA polymerase sigma subunit (sigma70/sigma32)